MIAAIESLLPIFVLIGLGFLLRWRGVVPADMWRGVELLGYWVFFPAILSETLIRADLSSLPLTAITVTMALAFATMAGGLLLLRGPLMRWLGLSGASYSSLFQNATRWNGFVALPILDKLYGDTGVALVAIIMAVLVPIANIVNVAVVARNAGSRQLTYGQTTYVGIQKPLHLGDRHWHYDQPCRDTDLRALDDRSAFARWRRDRHRPLDGRRWIACRRSQTPLARGLARYGIETRRHAHHRPRVDCDIRHIGSGCRGLPRLRRGADSDERLCLPGKWAVMQH